MARSPKRLAPRPVLFARVGWLEHYDSKRDGGASPIGGGSFNLDDDGSEVENFRAFDGVVYGYVRTPSESGGFNMERLGADPDADSADGVLVIFFSKLPGGRQVIVGWYDGARCLGEYFDRQGAYGAYNIVAREETVHVVPSDSRTHQVPKRKRATGQANIFYAEYPQQLGEPGVWIDEAVKYVLGRPGAASQPATPRAEVQPAGRAALGLTTFVPDRGAVKTRAPEPFTKDPDALDRALGAHRDLLNEIYQLATRRGFSVKRGVGGRSIDLGWQDARDFVLVEAKSLNTANENHQLRYGLGQVLEYAAMLRRDYDSVFPFLAIPRPPKDERWRGIFDAAGVTLVWPATFARLFKTRTRHR